MGVEDNSLPQRIEEKIKRNNTVGKSQETLEKVSQFLAKEENANCCQILGSIIDVDEAFQGFVDQLTEKILNSENVPDSMDSLNRFKRTDGGNFVADCSTRFENIEQTWFSTETVTRLTGEIGGALIGTAVFPGLGTVFGGILGGKLSTSVVGMLSS